MVGNVLEENLKTKDNVKAGRYSELLFHQVVYILMDSLLVRSIFNIDEDQSILSSKVYDEEKNLGELFAEPHREYLTTINPVFNMISGISHITGGGLPKNLPRIYNDNLCARVL